MADNPGPGASSTATVPRIARAGQAAFRGRVSLPGPQALLAAVVYLAVAIIAYGLPLIRHPGLPQVGQGVVDPNFYVWSLRWWPYAIAHGLNPLHSRQIGAPVGYDLSWTTTVPAVAVILAPVTAAFGPIASFNLTLLASAPLSAWAAFLAARRLTGRFWAAMMAGAVYGFAPYEAAQIGAGHPNLTVIMLLPVMLYLTLLWRDGKLGGLAFTALMAVAMAAEFYVFEETFAEMAVLWAVGLLIGFAVARPAERKAVARLAGLVSVAGVAALGLALPYLIYALEHAPAGFSRANAWTSLGAAGLLQPRAAILLGITLALAVLTWSSRLTRLLVILEAVTLALAVGPRGVIGSWALPWAARLWQLPIARSAQPVRFVIFSYLVLAMILALWLAIPTQNRLLLAARWTIGLAAVAAVLAYVPLASKGFVLPAGATSASARPTDALPAFISSGRYRDYLRPGETVVVVSDRGNAGLLFQADMNFYVRIAGGFINAALSDPSGLPAPVAALSEPTAANERRFRAYVRRAGVGAVIVESAWSAPWMTVFSRMGLHRTATGGVIIYRTG